ncbi:MAG: S1C family serine protease [Pseudorhodoplanes sp.]|nr:hypothetical protein [Pseudorhodoplanes sp.]MBW7948310.1 serine protease [Pseudorhodoplanes sp.]MCL4712488.1 S1C family serine protease [Pseudorhodoplanes sp.]MCQ3942054.1 serine protease [Alphaproteobacteria bacterium]GIK81092.1 MAG: signal protein PDZ [Alphaproteobacteria bacterium]
MPVRLHALRIPVLVAILLALAGGFARAQEPALTAEALVSSVVRVKTFINPDARTIENLGREREGSGVVIDGDGLVLTIGYLMVEAHAAEVTTHDGRAVPANIVGYDHETGFGLLQAIAPLKVTPLRLGRSAALRAGDAAIIVGAGGLDRVAPVRIAATREFAGSWEYLIDAALFTTPPYPDWSGAALVGREGTLVGIGSLIVRDTMGDGSGPPGNMFVPIDLLPPILADLIADGRSATPARPWLGVNAEEIGGRLVVARVTSRSPAEKAGIARGDVIARVAGAEPRNLADFYRRLWAIGPAGVSVPLDIERGGDRRTLAVPSMNRLDHLKLKSTF